VDLPKKAVDMYQSGLTMKEVAERFRLSKETVRERLREMGIRIRPRGLTYSRLADGEWLENEYLRKGRTARDIANRVGCAVLTVHYHLRRHGIPRKRQRRTRTRAT
jgi:DNA-binding NarL/FixJ family response regulator